MQRYLKVALLFFVLALPVFVFSHFWITDRLGVMRLIYPLPATLSNATISCSEGAPEWAADTLRYVTRNNGSLANQLAYYDAKGSVHHCENGWRKSMLTSDFVDQNTRFRYASITKVFTMSAILDLVKKGDISLDDKIVDMLGIDGELKDRRVNHITVESLLRHQAGFDRLETEDPLFAIKKKPWCPYELHRLREVALDFVPGSETSYSNIGYCLLGEVIRTVSGKGYRAFIEEKFDFAEAGVKFIDGPYESDEVRYDFRNSNLFGEEYYRFFDFSALSSSASLSGNAKELASAARAIAGNKAVANMKANEDCQIDQLRRCYGFAFYRYRSGVHAKVVLIAEGYLPGAASLVMVAENGETLALLTSGTPEEGLPQKKRLYRKIYGHLVH